MTPKIRATLSRRRGRVNINGTHSDVLRKHSFGWEIFACRLIIRGFDTDFLRAKRSNKKAASSAEGRDVAELRLYLLLADLQLYGYSLDLGVLLQAVFAHFAAHSGLLEPS